MSFIGEILLLLLMLFDKRKKYYRISSLFLINKKTLYIHQSISFGLYFRTWKLSDYDEHNFKRFLANEVREINFGNLNIDNRVLTCKTNKIVEKRLKRLSNSILCDGNYKIELQPTEKLALMNPIVIWKNLFNKKFWDFIYTKENVRKYYFILN